MEWAPAPVKEAADFGNRSACWHLDAVQAFGRGKIVMPDANIASGIRLRRLRRVVLQ